MVVRWQYPVEEWQALYEEGLSYNQIAKRYHVWRVTVKREIAALGAPPAQRYPLDEWRQLRAEGLSYDEIGERYGISHTTVFDWLSGKRGRERAWPRAEPMPRCQLCGIILERSGDAKHPNDSPNARYCWSCREQYPKLCKIGVPGDTGADARNYDG